MENNKKNILIVCDDLSLLGGSVITIIRMANALVKRGWKVVILTCNSNTIEELDPKIEIEFAAWYFFVRLGNNVGKVGGLSFNIARKVIKKYDIGVVLSANMGILGGGVSVVAHSFGIKEYSLCSAQVENALAGLPKIFNNIFFISFLKFWMKHYYHRMDFILPQSDFSKKYLFELGVNTPSEVVSNGVDLNVFKKETDPYVLGYLKRKYYIDTENDFNVVFLGRLSKEKCIETLIYATKLVSDKNLNIKCHIIGNGTMKDELINLARDLGLSKKVSFLGHIPRIDLIGILSLCDLYVHTSEIELEGMALLEAMACNLPILVSDSKTSASSQFVQNNGELFEHKNSLDLSNKIINLMNDNERCLRYGVNSLEVAKRYSFDENMDKLSNILSRDLSI